MVSMVTSVSLVASSKSSLIVPRSSCILLTSSAVLRSYGMTETLIHHKYTKTNVFSIAVFPSFVSVPCLV